MQVSSQIYDFEVFYPILIYFLFSTWIYLLQNKTLCVFPFITFAFGNIYKIQCLILKKKKNTLMFSSKSFIASAFAIWSLMPFEIIFEYGI